MTERLECTLDRNQPNEQAGFRKDFGTRDHIHTINLLKENCQEWNTPLCLTFIDYEKAFDSVETDDILKSLIQQGIETKYVKLLKFIYTNCKATTSVNNHLTQIGINKSVRQGTPSPQNFLVLA